MNLSIIMPCYNEEQNIPRIKSELVPVLDRLNIDSYEIILVDDGSTDKSYDVARSLNLPQLRIVGHTENRNIGAAFRTGFKEARNEACMTYDTDFAYPVHYIEPLLNRFLKGDVDFVSGSPELAGFSADTPLYRKIISRLANSLYTFALGKNATAVTHTFRIYKTKDMQELNLESNGFDTGAEALFKLVIKNHSFAEIPVPLTQRRFGHSKLNYKKEMLRHLLLLKKIIVWRVKNVFCR